MSKRSKTYLIAAAGVLLITCCAGAMLGASLLKTPAADPAAWSAAAQAASSDRLMAFLASLAFGTGCTSCVLPMIILAGVLLWWYYSKSKRA